MQKTVDGGMNIYQKLAKIRKQVEVIQATARGYNYTYVAEDEILARISTFMDKYGLSLIPSVKPGSISIEFYNAKKTKFNKAGAAFDESIHDIVVSADMTFTWVNNGNPDERIEVPWILVGQQTDGSQSFGSGLSYAMRYFLLKFFNIATPNDDPDNWRSKQKAAEAAEDKMVSEQIVKLIDIEIKSYLAKNPDKKDDVKSFATKYVKGGNYLTIADPSMASRMLSDFKSVFESKEEK